LFLNENTAVDTYIAYTGNDVIFGLYPKQSNKRFQFVNDTASKVTLSIKTPASPTLDAFEILDSSSNVLASFSKEGYLKVPNLGLRAFDTDASHLLTFKPGSNLTADRTLTFTTGDSDRTIDLGGNVTTAAAFTTSGANSLTLTTTAGTNVTLPTSGTLVAKDSTDVLTNKTYDAEGTGNVFTSTTKIWLPGAGCNNATPYSFWDLPASTPAVATCVTGTNTQKAYLDFADTSGGFSAQTTLQLPSDFTGNIDADIIWLTAATSGNVKWSLSTICVATNATETDDPAFNTASTVTTAAPGTGNRLQTSTITSLTITGCAASEMLHLRIFRDGNDAADTIANTARLYGISLTMRRQQ
jgi:hypothetical protein